MDCKKVNKLISYYVDSECPPETGAEILEHISKCAECKKDYILYKKLPSLLKNLRDLDPSCAYNPSFERKMAILRKPEIVRIEKSSYLRNNFFKLAIPAVAAMLVMFSGLLFFISDVSKEPISPRITYVKGDVSIIDENAVLQKAHPQTFAMSGKSIITGKYGKIDIVMPNRFKISISENANVKFDEIIEQQNQYKFLCTLRQGKLLADVNNRGLKTDFQIRTNIVNVKVRGTQFFVEAFHEESGNTVEVAVLDGKVEVTQDVLDRREVKTVQYTVSENEKRVFYPEGRFESKSELSARDFESLLEVYDINKRDVEVKYTSGPTDKSIPFRSESFE